MSDQTEAQVIGDYAQQAQRPTELDTSAVYAVAGSSGEVQVVDTDTYGRSPRRVQANRTVSDAESFALYLEKHGLPETEVYADTPSSSVVAVIDSHKGADLDAGWQQHKVKLVLQKTKSWIAWTENDGTWFDQIAFAEFIEQRATDVRLPVAGDLMSLAQEFYMTKGVEYESSSRLADGQTTLVYKEKVATRGVGNIEVPKELELVLQPYENGPRQYAYANFRTRLNGATLQIGYVLVRPDEILDGVFADIVNEFRDGRPANPEKGIRSISPITHPIYFGKPQ